MITYTFLQHYWWFLISLLGGLLVFLFFVQGANTLIFCAGKTEEERELIVNSTGRKWEFTFTTLVTFGGAFYASFPLFYSTSFSGAYWVWILILASFILQAIAYEFQSKPGNFLGKKTYRMFLVFNGILGPFLVGAAVGTFFTGSPFTVNKNMMGEIGPCIISHWDSPWHGLEALGNVWNWVLGIAVYFLARVLGALYLLNNIQHEKLNKQVKRNLAISTIVFLIFFLSFVGYLGLAKGFAVDPGTGAVFMQPYKYVHNFVEMPVVLAIFLVGVVLVLAGILLTLLKQNFRRGIWLTGPGVVFAVLALLLIAGYNNTAYYPSVTNLNSSLTIFNSSSTMFTLKTMSIVSLLIPFVLIYIFYAWHAIDKKSLTEEDLKNDHHKY